MHLKTLWLLLNFPTNFLNVFGMSWEAETKVLVKQNLVSAKTKMKKDELVSGVTSFGQNLVSGDSGKSYGRN